MKFTAAELRDEAERELLRRRRSFPAKVARRRMTEGAAERQIQLQEAIVATLAELEKAERFL
jgi:hypothetical protein